MATMQHVDPTYVLSDSLHERRRLQEQSNIVNPFTRQLLENAGIRAGMRILDVGSGAGDVALLLADIVGPGGTVVGVDRNPTVLETARERAAALQLQNTSFVASDVRALNLQGDFDAVVGRAVLMYIADPVEALQRALRFVRPGGVIAFHEYDFTTLAISVPHSALLEKLRYWIYETFKRAGTEMQMGFKLRQTYLDAGLPEPKLHCDVVMGGGEDWSGYAYAVNSLRSLLPYTEEFGVATREEIEEEIKIDTLSERLRNDIVRQNGVVLLSTWMSAWTRKV
ncbi:MAG: class I SAM-dependent methyltransferase [Caldilineaceae bacterium]|nr:class I SAM-dependent methyltransferase [Caldilineaceae bacterium]